ncbi:HNH endonuclease [Vreelandella venusta]|uniref:HNH endonuclease n=1 Tax=Vreelandella venusta TaxID=44935 RepID=UPI00200C5EFF|nr:HNH endonuclease [Halomonas venusta]UQI42704.1 HNH endonuclease [Halomonas venusta]
MRKTREITPEIVKEFFSYEPESGVLTWKTRSIKWFKSEGSCKRWNSIYAGKRAGSEQKHHRGGYEYRCVCIFDHTYTEHKIIWMWMTGENSENHIDHKNRKANDNRWENLRLANHQTNGRNQSMPRRNSTGITGVSWHSQHKKWAARCGYNGAMHYLGYFDDLDLAAMEVLEFRYEHGFDPQHGLAIAHYHRAVL